MTTAQLVTLSLVIFFGLSLALALLWGKFVSAGQDPEPSPPEQPAKPSKEDALIATLEALIAKQRGNLAILRALPPTVQSIRACGDAVVSIEGAQEVLHMLYMRRCRSFDGTAAAHFEGRM